MNTLSFTDSLTPFSSHNIQFPVEILELIFQELERGHRLHVLQCSKLFYAVASRLQYRHISDLKSPRQCVGMLKAICANQAYAKFVRHLSIDLHLHQVTGNLLRLLNRALKQVACLQSLRIEFSPRDNELSLAWIFNGCTFALRALTTSVPCDAPLARFLETQGQLTELCLRGFQTTSPFLIAPSAMPKLTVFRTVHAGVPVLTQILPGRPIEGVSLSLFSDEGFLPLNLLASCSGTIKRLTIMSLDCTPLDAIIPEVASRVPGLEALHVVVLMAPCSSETLLASAPLLAQFHRLRYLTFMATGPSGEDERDIAALLHQACPTLKTIILPKGRVWFQKDGKWAAHGHTPPTQLIAG